MSNSVNAYDKLPLMVEIAGLAGSGKTTLLYALVRHKDKFRLVSDLEIRDATHLPIFARHAKFLLSLAQNRRHHATFTWDDMKAMVYLKTWPQRLRQQATRDSRAVLLNHGPVFKLATLHAFGPERLRSQDFAPWWYSVFQQWSHTLGLVVWLKAPVDVLIERINARSQPHAVKGKSADEASAFLARYQQSYEFVLTKLHAYAGLTPLTFDTRETSVETIVDEVLDACHMRFERV